MTTTVVLVHGWGGSFESTWQRSGFTDLLTDAGRTALGGSMGPEIIQIEGKLLSTDNSEYVVGVSLVRLLRGGEQVWRGETVRIKTEYVSSLYERRLSASRSLALGATARRSTRSTRS